MENPDKKAKAIKALMNELGLEMEEAMQMIESVKNKQKNENRVESETEEQDNVELDRMQDTADAKNDQEMDNELLPPEQEVKEEVPQTELDIAKQIFANANIEDFKSVDSPAGQAITLDAKAHPGLAKEDVGYDTWLVIRGPLVAKGEKDLVVGMGRAVVITQPE